MQPCAFSQGRSVVSEWVFPNGGLCESTFVIKPNGGIPKAGQIRFDNKLKFTESSRRCEKPQNFSGADAFGVVFGKAIQFAGAFAAPLKSIAANITTRITE